MEIEVPKELLENIKTASKELGLSEKEIIAMALNLYLRNIKDYASLREEINAWEESGAQDYGNFLEKNSL